MKIEDAQEQIAELLMTDGSLEEILSDRIDSFLGSEIEVRANDVYVVFQDMSFTFKNARVSMDDRCGGSQEEDSIDREQNFTVRGRGMFECSGGKVTRIYDVSCDNSEEGDVKIIRD